MRIGFIISSTGISGGYNVILEQANGLQRSGHWVILLLDQRVMDKENRWHYASESLNIALMDDWKDGVLDVLIATFWKTCYSAFRIPAKYYVYFNQSVESRFYKERHLIALAESTYFLEFLIITEATWIRDYLVDTYGIEAHLVKNGVKKALYKQFMKERPIHYSKLRILVEGPVDVDFKNVKETIRICRRSRADEIWLLTTSRITAYPGVDRVFSCIPIEETPAIYGACDVLVKLSLVEGMFGPPLEMFHCGGTAIVYKVSGYDEYIRDGVNAFALELGDEQGVINSIDLLYSNRQLLATLQRGALATALEWPDWNSSNIEFEKVLRAIASGVSNNYLYINRVNYLGVFGEEFQRQRKQEMVESLRKLNLYEIARLFSKTILFKMRRKLRFNR